MSGRLRPVPHAAGRLKEALKLGFRGAVVPPQSSGETEVGVTREVALLGDLVHRIAPDGVTDAPPAPTSGDDG